MGKGRPKKKRQYHRLSEGERGRAFGMFESGTTQTEIGLKLGCSQQAVSLIAKKFEKEQTFKDLPRSGRQENLPS